jgi:hypothetical protein
MSDKMVNLKVDETSGVNHPAHLLEGWVVIKSAPEVNVDDKEHNVPDDKNTPDPIVADEADAVVKDARIVALEGEVATLTAERDSAVAKAAETETPETPESAIEKALGDMPESIRVAFAKERGERETLAKALEVERSERADEKAIEKAAGYKNLGLDPTEIGPALRALSENDADLSGTIIKALNALAVQVETSDLFKAAGFGGDTASDSDDPTKQVMAKAQAMVDAGESTNFAKAVEAVATLHPDLYAAHRDARR